MYAVYGPAKVIAGRIKLDQELQPPTGNQPSQSPKTSASKGPVTKVGTLISASAANIALASTQVCWRTAAIDPSQTPAVVASRNAVIPSVAETGSPSANSPFTERSRNFIEIRKSPRSKSPR